MARKKITADLNGGDSVTPMADLEFQIHNAIDDSIIAAANYAAIGSVNANGTDGANITYTLNPVGGAGGNGQIILDGVEIGSAISVKIRAKDADGNESILSPAFSLYLFQDDFAGTTIDLTKWTLTESAAFTYSQNDELILTAGSISDGNTLEENLLANSVVDFASFEAITFNVISTNQSNNDWSIGLTKDADVTTNSDRLALQRTGVAGNVSVLLKEANSVTKSSNSPLDITTKKSIKITNLAGIIGWWYWNGSVWVSMGTSSHTSSGNWKPYIAARDLSASSGNVIIDDFIISDTDFATETP